MAKINSLRNLLISLLGLTSFGICIGSYYRETVLYSEHKQTLFTQTMIALSCACLSMICYLILSISNTVNFFYSRKSFRKLGPTVFSIALFFIITCLTFACIVMYLRVVNCNECSSVSCISDANCTNRMDNLWNYKGFIVMEILTVTHLFSFPYYVVITLKIIG